MTTKRTAYDVISEESKLRFSNATSEKITKIFHRYKRRYYVFPRAFSRILNEEENLLKEFFKELVRYNILKEVKEVMCPHCQETDIMEISEFKCTSETECSVCGEYYNPQNINETVYQVNVKLYKRRKFKKEMVYCKKTAKEVLFHNTYKGYEFCILSLGTHPCAYVNIPKNSKYYKKHYGDIPVDCHGGLTYSDDKLNVDIKQDSCWWIGWDYAHCDDYRPFSCISFREGKKWTTGEIFREVKDVINQLREVEKNDKD